MRLFRICKARWADTAFSGEGSLRYAGRWHFAGTPMIYTATSRPLAALEVLVHLEVRHAPPSFVLIPAKIPDDLLAALEDPPSGWDTLPPGDGPKTIGTDWARSRASVGLVVPSVVVRGEHNVLLNPLHPDFRRVEVGEPERFSFDSRLLVRA